jgi:hypothetical protein
MLTHRLTIEGYLEPGEREHEWFCSQQAAEAIAKARNLPRYAIWEKRILANGSSDMFCVVRSHRY